MEDADDLVPDSSNPGAPAAVRERSERKSGPVAAADLRMKKNERALVRKSLASIVAMPILRHARSLTCESAEREPPVAVLSIDSDSGLQRRHDDNAAMRTLMLDAVDPSSFVDGS